jgi:hypothetical protein
MKTSIGSRVGYPVVPRRDHGRKFTLINSNCSVYGYCGVERCPIEGGLLVPKKRAKNASKHPGGRAMACICDACPRKFPFGRSRRRRRQSSVFITLGDSMVKALVDIPGGNGRPTVAASSQPNQLQRLSHTSH